MTKRWKDSHILVIILPILLSFGHYIAGPFFFWSLYCLSFIFWSLYCCEISSNQNRRISITLEWTSNHHVRRRRWACRSQTEICRNLGDLGLDEISHYLYVRWSNRNIIHVNLLIDLARKRKWNQVNTSFNQTISNLTECQVTAW
jgi:hypothetical protein